MSNPGCTPEYNAQTRKMMDDLDRLRDEHAKLARNQARMNQVGKQTEGLQERLKANDLERPAKRVAPEQSEELKNAIAQRNVLHERVDQLVKKGDRLNQSLPRKIADFATNLHMFNIFLAPFVYPKLAAAVLGGHALALTQAAGISLARLIIPGIRRIANISERQGAGLTADGLRARFGGQAWSDALKGAKETWSQGHSNLEAANGHLSHATDAYWGHIGTLYDALKNTPGKANKFFEASRVVASYPGRTHGMIKQFLSVPEFYQSIADRTTQIRSQMSAAGHSSADIEHFLGLESTQATIHAKAMLDAYESKMQGKNVVSDAVIGTINRMVESQNPLVSTLGYVAKNVMPVARVGANVFKQTTSLTLGSVKAALMNAYTKANVSRIAAKSGEDWATVYKREMTPERADYIVKNIGQNLAGLGVFTALGIMYGQYMGGVPGTKKVPKSAYTDPDSTVIKPDEARIANVPVGAWAFHGAPAAQMQIGASLKDIFQREQNLKHKDAVDTALTALGSTLGNYTARTVPEFDVVRRGNQTLEYARGGERRGYPYGSPWGELLGTQVRSMVEPLGMQQYAQYKDPYKGFRAPRNIEDDLKLGIPGLREEVPTR